MQPGLEREHTEKMLREMQTLRTKLDALENENVALKKSIYDLSARYSASRQRAGPYLIDYDEDAALAPEFLEKADSLGREVSESLGHAPREKQSDKRVLQLKHDLKNHTGAVYTVKYSLNGKMIASGSFDKTVRIWEHQKEVTCFRKHTLNVSDLSWTHDSTELLSGSYDQTCKIWSLSSEKLKTSFDCDGFVQTVMFHPQGKHVNLFAAGTSRNKLLIYDQRQADPIQTFTLDGMVNSLYFCTDGNTIITGDANGSIDAWSLCTSRWCIESERSGIPISHVTTCRSAADRDEDAPYLAVNSYDNVIRVYKRNQEPDGINLRLLHSLKGCKNKNWPIRSSLFEGREHASLVATTRHSSSHSDELFMDDDDGAAAGYNNRQGTGHLLQRLEGHTDRVYSVDFHPTEPILCSCSADATIKIWAPVGRAKKKRDPIHL
ncbi:WD40-repeat-containing domain protein [Syncephalis pseudoplumigaleata]|uniref:WD40-repeat-containing domain protein n=1 Tax=Syncephalis pseudoplumigaleata TaxID=1712513 RepID=A0A4P9Z5R4_9FUNG|nr:WD40-repeat-containing domain protein [Syncephalis pseudoplumigaleata]|eukprot:RKP27973.1 WD40-repeat-containing domain protein [Syncephalis pseudoplumigaleata]